MTKERLEKFDQLYIKFAYDVSKMSYANRKKVGCVITKGNNILSYGFNGTPTNFSNECEDLLGNTKDNVIHAEMNAILKAAKEGSSLKDSTLYITLSPCIKCALSILQAGISKVIYVEEYRDVSGINLLKKANIIIQKLPIVGKID